MRKSTRRGVLRACYRCARAPPPGRSATGVRIAADDIPKTLEPFKCRTASSESITGGPGTRGRQTVARAPGRPPGPGKQRSEEHTSELQSLMRISYAVFCLKKKNKTS